MKRAKNMQSLVTDASTAVTQAKSAITAVTQAGAAVTAVTQAGAAVTAVQEVGATLIDASAVTVSPETEESAEIVSPDHGIRYPDGKEALERYAEGCRTVFGVKTFPDSFIVTEPAGSIWLSSEKAIIANKHGGSMRVFNASQDICLSIAEVANWIKSQNLTPSTKIPLVSECKNEESPQKNKNEELAQSKNEESASASSVTDSDA